MQERKEDKDFEDKLKHETQEDIKKIYQDFERNKDKVINMLIENVLSVDLTIPMTIREKFASK